MKNPWMSLWLSAANSWTSAARGQVAAEAKRNQNAFLAEANKQMVSFWTAGAAPATKAAKRPASAKKRRR